MTEAGGAGGAAVTEAGGAGGTAVTEAALAPAVPAAQCCAPLSAPRLTDEEAQATATLFKALGDPQRVRIVNLLATAGGALCVCDLTEPLGIGQPTVSHHLKKLTAAGLLDREERGTWAYYSLNPEATRRLAAVADLQGACG